MTRYGLCILTFLLSLAAYAGEDAPRLHVADGFIIERIAAEPNVVYPMFAAFDDRGRLFVAESSGLDLYAELKAQTRKCRIRLLEDPDEHGRFRKSSVFADKLVFPMGLAWRDGKLYVADPPDLVTLEDTDGDGKADKRTVILTGFGHVANGSLHGLTFGPDGLLYMTMGRPDGYKIKRRDGVVVIGKTGALLRCRPDGSDPEVLCRGFENLVEVIFTPRGDIIGTDNWFQRPVGGMRDALIHLVDGGLYPMHGDEGTPQPVTGEFLPALSLYPAVALSGLERYRGQAFPDMQGHLFSAQHNARKVGRHVLVPHSSTFRAEDFDFVTSDSPDFHPSDVLEDADGSLLVVDTGSWYVQHCPTGQIRKVRATGGIYRVRKKGTPKIEDPRGLRIDWDKATNQKLVGLLGDDRPAVRDRAQQALTARGRDAILPLSLALKHGKHPTPRQHAVWALAGMEAPQVLPALRGAIDNADVNVSIPAIRALGVRRDGGSARRLEGLLGHQEPAVRLAAAEALARCGDNKSVAALNQALAKDDVDRFLEHAVVLALFHLASTADLETGLRAVHPRIRKAALILLDQPPRPRDRLQPKQVIDALISADPELRQTATAILRRHTEWVQPAVGLLEDWLQKPDLSAEDERGLRGIIVAFQSAPPVQDVLAQAVVNAQGKVANPRRRWVLEAMAETSLPKLPPSWIDVLGHALDRVGPKEIRLQAVRTTAVLQVAQLDDTLARLAEHEDEPVELRLEAARAIVLRRPQLPKATFALLHSVLKDEEQPLLRLAAAEVVGRAQLTEDQVRLVLVALRDDVLVSPSVVLPALLLAKSNVHDPLVANYIEQAVQKGWRPSEAELKRLVQRFTANGEKGPAFALLVHKVAEQQKVRLGDFEPLLKGGDPVKGRAVFLSKKTACGACHRIGQDGGTVGPDLTKIGAVRAGRDLLESIVVPSSTIAQGYDPYVFVTDDGKVFNGLIARQSADTLVVRDASGAELQLRKSKIQEMRRATVSLMPEGLERTVSQAEFRDLLAYLLSLK